MSLLMCKSFAITTLLLSAILSGPFSLVSRANASSFCLSNTENQSSVNPDTCSATNENSQAELPYFNLIPVQSDGQQILALQAQSEFDLSKASISQLEFLGLTQDQGLLVKSVGDISSLLATAGNIDDASAQLVSVDGGVQQTTIWAGFVNQASLHSVSSASVEFAPTQLGQSRCSNVAVSEWVGIGSGNNVAAKGSVDRSLLAQIGLISLPGNPANQVFTELYPIQQHARVFQLPISPGTKVVATVKYLTNDLYSFTLLNTASGQLFFWSESAGTPSSFDQLGSSQGEVIVERVSNSNALFNLANFGTVSFSAFRVNGVIVDSNVSGMTIANEAGAELVAVSPFDPQQGFNVTQRSCN